MTMNRTDEILHNVTSIVPHTTLTVPLYHQCFALLAPRFLGGPSPTRLIDHEYLETVSATMAFEIFAYGQVSLRLDVQNLASIVSSALELTLPPLTI